MQKLLSQVKSYDVFGVPVSVNYKGASKFNTLPGAILSLCLKGLVFVTIVLSIMDLVTYKNPSLSQVSVLSLSSVIRSDQVLFFLVLHL